MTLITRTGMGRIGWLALMDGEVSNFREYYPRDKDKNFTWFNDSTNRLVMVARGDKIDLYSNGSLVDIINITEGPPDKTVKAPQITIPDNVLPGQLEQFGQLANEQDQREHEAQAQLDEARKNFSIKKPFLYDGLLGFLAARCRPHDLHLSECLAVYTQPTKLRSRCLNSWPRAIRSTWMIIRPAQPCTSPAADSNPARKSNTRSHTWVSCTTLMAHTARPNSTSSARE